MPGGGLAKKEQRLVFNLVFSGDKPKEAAGKSRGKRAAATDSYLQGRAAVLGRSIEPGSCRKTSVSQSLGEPPARFPRGEVQTRRTANHQRRAGEQQRCDTGDVEGGCRSADAPATVKSWREKKSCGQGPGESLQLPPPRRHVPPSTSTAWQKVFETTSPKTPERSVPKWCIGRGGLLRTSSLRESSTSPFKWNDNLPINAI